MTEETKPEAAPENDPRLEGLSTARQVVVKLTDQLNKVATDRGKVYGDPEENFANIAALWNIYFRGRFGEEAAKKCQIRTFDIGYLNVLQKIARLSKTPFHPDSVLDIMNYAGLGFGCAVWEDQIMAAVLKEQLEKMKAQAEAQEQAKKDAAKEEEPFEEPKRRHKRVD